MPLNASACVDATSIASEEAILVEGGSSIIWSLADGSGMWRSPDVVVV